jgi:hypothetical protein
MKILLVGSNFNYAIERYYVRYLKQFGADINHFPAADIVFNYHSKNLFNKILFKTKINTGYKPVNQQLMKIAYDYEPDVIWIFKGMEIYPDTLDKLRKDFWLSNYNPDHPFLITSSGSGNNNVTQSVGLYHLHFCYHTGLKQQIEQNFRLPTVFLPFAYEKTDMVYTEQNTIKEIGRICFQGNPDKYRAGKIDLLTKAGMEVDVFGIGWQNTNLRTNKRVRLFNIVPRPEFWKLNQEYRVQLNLFRAYNNGSHNMRTFEIPVVGGIQLSPFSDEQSLFFDANKEIFFFMDDDEMIEKAKKILGMKEDESESIRMAARKRSLESPYSFEDRSLTVFETFKKYI